MAEVKGAKQIAMSKALGAAFLNHQVEQLEKSVHNNRAASSGNWRDRDRDRNSKPGYSGPAPQRRGPNNKLSNGGAAGGGGSRKRGDGDGERDYAQSARSRAGSTGEHRSSRRSDEQRREKGGDSKDADVVVVDASLLVHALSQLKKWSKLGREEIIIVPLEALNTLDLLKKGTTSLAQRARAASRFLESQVGNNPRIRVQRDDAFVPWDEIAFLPDSAKASDAAADDDDKHNDKDKPSKVISTAPSPEWVRRIICCARWEIEHAKEETDLAASPITIKANQDAEFKSPSSANSSSPDFDTKQDSKLTQHLKVVLAVCTTAPTSSPLNGTSKLPSEEQGQMTPVPLPAPSHHHYHHGAPVPGTGVSLSNKTKYEPRTMGTHVGYWAGRADIEVLDLQPTPPPGPHQSQSQSRGTGVGANRSSSEEDPTPKRILSLGPVGQKLGAAPGSPGRVIPDGPRNGSGGRRNNNNSFGKGRGGGESSSLVERSPAVLAMMEMVQRTDSKTVRVLARGEKLDPDT
ncbi:hypothetical protein D9757_013219 [Collybiopsis confluens]|uniref:PIN domain-containing protein n=1 Tax=Collybiopsis confluens TaxID=2823264 RepID=A0A8H5GA91_9AGAR|nr:hypothetical protein D9757_013219 [Collybiopsis confluens]